MKKVTLLLGILSMVLLVIKAEVQQSDSLDITLADSTPVDSIPVDSIPVDTIPVDSIPIDSIPVDSIPIDSIPVDSIPIDSIPIDTIPVDSIPIDSIPVDSIPIDSIPMDSIPVDSIPIDTIPVSEYSISGKILVSNYDSLGINDVIILAFNINNMGINALTYTNTDSYGNYSLYNLVKGNYLLYAIPNPYKYPNYLPTYFVDKINWSSANMVELEGHAYNVNIVLEPLNNDLVGNYSISGNIIYKDTTCYEKSVYSNDWFNNDTKKSSSLGNMAQNMPILLYNDNDNVVGWTISDSNGDFIISGLPSGTYSISGEKPGHKVITNDQVVIGDKNIEGISVMIRDNDIVSNVSDVSNSTFNVYPNPVNDILNIDLYNVKEYSLSIEIYNSTGILVRKQNIDKVEGQSIINIDLTSLESGLYHLIILDENGDKKVTILK